MRSLLPHLTSDAQAESFIDTSDLSQFNLSAMRSHNFEFTKKSKQLNLRFPEQLLDTAKSKATAQGSDG